MSPLLARSPIRRAAAKVLLATFCAASLWPSALAQQPAGYELALVDLRGRKQVLGTLPGSVFAPRVSPDGKQVAFELADAPGDATPASTRVYVAELAHLEQRRALPLVGGARNWAPIWSPDGERLVFLVSGDSPDALWIRRADGSDSGEQLVEGRAPEGLTADGKQLVFITRTGATDYGLSLFDIASRTVSPLVDRQSSDQHSSRLSPDGRWLAYASNETGRQEIWLTRMPPDGERFRLTDTGGRHPLWSPDGSTLYFDQDGQMFRIQIFLGAAVPKASEPKSLRIRGFQQGELRRQFDLLPDGKRFLMLFPL
jgi:eukaryotic-like serine/threonine-protein kinase